MSQWAAPPRLPGLWPCGQAWTNVPIMAGSTAEVNLRTSPVHYQGADRWRRNRGISGQSNNVSQDFLSAA